MAEVSREKHILANYSPESLRRNELTEDGKRWQLWGKGVKGKEADEIIERLYPKAPQCQDR